MDALSASDVALVTGRNGYGYGNGYGGLFGDNGIVWGLLLGGLFTGNGFFGGNNRQDAVTEAGLCNAMNFNNMENAVGRMSDQQQNQTMTLSNGICNLGYETLRNFNTLEAQVSQCCCGIERNIDAVRYEAAQNTAAINANTSAQVQKVLDAICTNRMTDMQNQINQLQLQSALCGVVRYPNSMAYNAGTSPFCGCGCGCNGNNGFANI